ncbi:hypothetical protein IC582_001643 [Cucumis melo]|uniref:Adenylyl cyclase-associated protein n=1 Tax=Cucumis melo var. makuwa TaxID=1194695 RepID=A0A5A7T4V2_CUCMM|nr:cyclase-associated protein 1 [Cucumis melo var. makuwa]TYK03347.1 cyclase-associated protein 1 [Cucumis melo var. makuwa]
MEEKLIQRLESAVCRLEALSPAGFSTRGISLSNDDNAASEPPILAFEDLMRNYVRKVSDAAEKIGGPVLEATRIVEEAFSVEKQLLVDVKQTRKPDLAGLAGFLKPLNEVILKANTLTAGKRSEFFNHLKTVADALSALAWIAYTGKECGMSMPIAHVEESWQTAEFYSNKILVEFKSKDQNHVEWAKAMKELFLTGLRDYVKSFYPLGPVWNPAGKMTPATSTKVPAPSASAPPPPSAPLFNTETSQASARPKEGMAAVFQEISSGKSVTGGLRKVTDDMKTKNRAERTGIVNTNEIGHRNSPSVSKPVVAPNPKFELQMGRKWAIEHQIGKKDLVISDCDSKQSVYIYGCKDSVLQVQGKVNNITIDKCSKTGVVFTDVVAACEVVNCNGIEIQCQGSAPTISVDNTGGCQLYLSNDSLKASITTAKSSEINVLVRGSDPDGDWVEHALPQQFVHVLKDGHIETTPVSHSGA